MHRLFFDMLLQQRINVKDLIRHRFKASDARGAYEMLCRNRTDAVGVILDFGEP
jgi:threonine dehydrogenase-like Zn-dependent dehydrogenase